MSKQYPFEDEDFTEETATEETEKVDLTKETDPEAVKAAMELIEEKYTEPGKDTSVVAAEPVKPTEENKDTSADPEDKTETDVKPKPDEAKPTDGEETPPEKTEPAKEDEFSLTDDIISKQPEADREMLQKYAGKPKAELAKAAANAIALKNPFLKDDKESIERITKKILLLNNDEIIKTLTDSQRETGKSTATEKTEPVQKPVTEFKLPEIPDDPNVQKLLSQETLKSLKKKYPEMPDDPDSPEYKEWRRDLQYDNPDNTFKDDLKQAELDVKGKLSKILYIQTNLSNLFENSPEEILPRLNDQNLPRLKALNDDPWGELVKDTQREIDVIRNSLKEYGLTEKDLGIDFTITKDKEGLPYNEVINSLIISGVDENGKPILNSEIIKQRAKTFWLSPGQLADKFDKTFRAKIITTFANKQTSKAKMERERLKENTLPTVGGTTRGQAHTTIVKPEDLQTTSLEQIQKIQADLEAKLK